MIKPEFNPELRRRELRREELKKRIKNATSLFVDIDKCLFPGPIEIEENLSALQETMSVIACTARPWGEMIQENYPGRETLISSPFCICEGGLVVLINGEEVLMCPEEELEKLEEIKQLVNKQIQYTGPRSPQDKYTLLPDPNNAVYGYLTSSLGEAYVRDRAVPLQVVNYPDQRSLVIWPSGTARECPSEREYYQICYFLDGLRAGRPDLMENISITITDGSVMLRPLGKDGRPITKLTGVRFLEDQGIIKTQNSIFIGDDGVMDLEVAVYMNANKGVSIAPGNADPEMLKIAQLNAPGYAGEAIYPALQTILQLKTT